MSERITYQGIYDNRIMGRASKASANDFKKFNKKNLNFNHFGKVDRRSKILKCDECGGKTRTLIGGKCLKCSNKK